MYQYNNQTILVQGIKKDGEGASEVMKRTSEWRELGNMTLPNSKLVHAI